jgi:O-antigen ligase
LGKARFEGGAKSQGDVGRAIMVNHVMKLILVLLILFTPLPQGSVDFWAFSTMELAILAILLLWAAGQLKDQQSLPRPLPRPAFIFLLLFLALVLLQTVPLPGGMIDLLSPRTYDLRHQLKAGSGPVKAVSLSFFPFATKIEFLKWMVLSGFFLFFLHWRLPDKGIRVIKQLIVVILIMGTFESFYGLFRFFGVQNHLLNLEEGEGIYSVMGTFINRNHFAGYLLMVIPLSVGFLYSREAHRVPAGGGRLPRLSSLDATTLVIGFSVIVMILGFLFSASRMGIVSLLLSFSVIAILFKRSDNDRKFSKRSVWMLGLALLWAASIGLDAVISRFFGTSGDFQMRWEIWGGTLQMIRDFPLFGAGLGTFTQVFPMYRSFHIRGLATHAENDFLQLASEAGLLGFTLLLILFVVLFVKAASGIRSLSAVDPKRYIGIGGLVGILALMFHSQVERNLQVPGNAFLYTLLWGIVLKVSSRNVGKKPMGEKT